MLSYITLDTKGQPLAVHGDLTKARKQAIEWNGNTKRHPAWLDASHIVSVKAGIPAITEDGNAVEAACILERFELEGE